jgi:tetraacyldisaccharide-1-P 4'-kinase
VELVAFGDHHAYGPGDAEALARRAGPAGVVVTTAKDGVKLRGLWPTGAPPCLVAMLAVQITSGAGDLGALLDRVAAAARDLQPGRPGRPGAIR